MSKILLIEDNHDVRENTAEILELANYAVVTAENGKIGVEKALEEKPDLIICDIMMPVLDGYGVLHMINKHEDLKNIPFIFLTAKAERGDFRKGMEMGADDYITKPFTDIELLNSIESRLRKVELLKKNYTTDIKGMHEFMQDLGKGDALKNLAEGRNINHYRKKQIIYTEGNHPGRMFYVVSGKVKTFKSNDDGKELTVGLYSEGEFFGYIALLENGVYRESAEAMEDSEIALIPRDDFESLINNNSEVSRKFIKMLAHNVVEREEQLLNLAYNSLRKRVADALITLQRKYKRGTEEHFSIHISREDLANIAGTATESLIRTLSDFRGEKLIDIKDGNIILLNEKKLQSMLN
ncbi:MAG TPA: response regulator [Chitinophagaceae bacterium]|nr:response regulator [Chitinophagaceae bacterium]